MRDIFFFSYARFNSRRDKLLPQFYEDLSERIAELRPMNPAEMQPGYIDERDLEGGAEWQPELITAMQNSRVLLCVYSPHYLVSEYCGREWHIFHMRRVKYPAAVAPGVRAALRMGLSCSTCRQSE